MKTKNLFGLAIALICLAACKKESQVIEPPTEKPNETEIVLDSVSYTLDGKLFKLARYWSGYKETNLQSNSKVDSAKNYSYYISGDKDSVMYSKTYSVYDDAQSIDFIFIKKFFKKSLRINGILYQPDNPKDFYAVGVRNYAVDYERENSQNGVAIKLSNQGRYQTYSHDSIWTPETLGVDAHKNSKFEIISLKKTKSGLYLLEAKFTAAIFDDKGKKKTLENGYLKLNLGLIDEYYK